MRVLPLFILAAVAPVAASAAAVYYGTNEAWFSDKNFSMVSFPGATEISFTLKAGPSASYFESGLFDLVSLELTDAKGASPASFNFFLPAASITSIDMVPVGNSSSFRFTVMANVGAAAFSAMAHGKTVLIADFLLNPGDTPEPRSTTLVLGGLTALSLTARRRRRRQCALSCGPARK